MESVPEYQIFRPSATMSNNSRLPASGSDNISGAPRSLTPLRDRSPLVAYHDLVQRSADNGAERERSVRETRSRPKLGRRKQKRFDNDRHVENGQAVRNVEELVKNLKLTISWRSAFEPLTDGSHPLAGEVFRKNTEQVTLAKVHKYGPRRKDDWNEAEEMYLRIESKIRTLLRHTFTKFHSFIFAVERVLVGFIERHGIAAPSLKGQEIQGYAEKYAADLGTALDGSISLIGTLHGTTRLAIPLKDSAFHRLLVHAVGHFYGLLTKSEIAPGFPGRGKVLMIKKPKDHHVNHHISFCEFFTATRIRLQSSASSVGVDANSEKLPTDATLPGNDCDPELSMASSSLSTRDLERDYVFVDSTSFSDLLQYSSSVV